jgi:hypothetical protein
LARPPQKERGRCEAIVCICLDEIDRQFGVGFERGIDIAAAFNISDEMGKRCWPEPMKLIDKELTARIWALIFLAGCG